MSNLEYARSSEHVDSATSAGHSDGLNGWQRHSPLRRYLVAAGLVGLVTLLGMPMVPTIEPTNLVMFYLGAVVVAAIYLGRGPSILAAVLGVLALDFFYVPPHFTFAVSDTQYILTFIGLMIVGLVISALTARVREQADIAQRRERQTTELYELSRDLAASVGLEEILRVIIAHVGQTFEREAVVWVVKGGELALGAASPGWQVTRLEQNVAQWTIRHGEPASPTSLSVPGAAILCLPLKTAQSEVGVLGIRPPDPSALFPKEQRRLLESFASQGALAIERAQFAEQAKQAQVLQAGEKLQAALLNSISHDLRTPLVSITGTLSSLQEDGMQWDHQTRQSMIETAYADARRLNHLVGNLLDMTRIEAGAMRVRHELCDVQDVIGSAFDQLSDRLKGRNVTVEVPSNLPLVPMDFVLIVQVLVNLLDNAIKYSAPGEPIEVEASASGGELAIRVIDRGVGIPTADLQRIFDKFYRVRRPDGVIGTGLGLSICKGIVEAHHGQIKAANRLGGGTIMTVVLPLQSGGKA